MANSAGVTLSRDTGAYSQFSRIVSNVGDFNGDGIDDFLVTQNAGSFEQVGEYITYVAGATFVVFGGQDGPSTLNVGGLDGNDGFQILPGQMADPLLDSFYNTSEGLRLAKGIGDYNGDGLADIALATRSYAYAQSSYSSSGPGFHTPNGIFVLFGTEAERGPIVQLSNLESDEFQKITGLSGQITSLEAAGDVNGDGINDLILNHSEEQSLRYNYVRNAGDRPALGYVLFGTTDPDTVPDLVNVPDLDGTNCFSVSGLTNQISEGGYYGDGGYYGSNYANEEHNSQIVSLGDIDQDGRADLLIRTSRTTTIAREVFESYEEQTVDPTPDEPDSGDEYVISVGINPYTVYDTAIARRASVLLGDNAEALLDGVVQVDNNAASPDNLIALQWYDLSSDLTYPGFSYPYPETVWDYFDVAGIGDVNHDGYDDVAFSYPLLNGSVGGDVPLFIRNGAVYVFFGGPDGVDLSVFDDSTDTGLPVFFGLAAGQGAALVLHNSFPSYSTQDGVTNFGGVISAAGDVNGDDIGDFLISEERYLGPDGYGSVYLIFGRETFDVNVIDLSPAVDGLDGIGYRFIGEYLTQYDYLTGNTKVLDRQWLSAAGDLNGDGFDDILIGAPHDKANGTFDPNGGRVFVVYGGENALEAADDADGANDNVIRLENLPVDVETGVRPIEVSLRNGGIFNEYRNEGQGGNTIFTFVARRTGDLSQSVSFDYAVSGYSLNPATDSDFVGGVLPSGTVTFAAGSATASIEIAVQGDITIEASEQFQLTLSNLVLPTDATGGLVGDVFSFAQINNDDFPITVSTFSNSVQEGGALTFAVLRTGDTTSAAAVDYVLRIDGYQSATGDDFVDGLPRTGTIVFGANETYKTVSFATVDDALIENDERVQFELSNLTSTNPNATFDLQPFYVIGTVYNNDYPVYLYTDNSSVTEGSGDPLTFTLYRSGNTNVEVEVFYTLTGYPFNAALSASAADFVNGFPASGSHVFAPGETSFVLSFDVLDDTLVESVEYVALTLTGGVTSSGVPVVPQGYPVYSAIYNDDFNVELSVVNRSGAENGGPINVTIQRSGLTDVAVDVDYEISLGSYAGAASPDDVSDTLPRTGTLSFAAGQTEKTVTITPIGDTVIEDDEFVEVRLTDARSTGTGFDIIRQTEPGFIKIVNDDFKVEISGYGEYRFEDDGILRATITRSGRTNVEVAVDYQLSGVDVESDDLTQTLPLTGTVTFAAGETSKVITLNPVADAAIEPSELISLALSNARLTGSGIGTDAVISLDTTLKYLQITNDDFPIRAYATSASANEGSNLTFTIYRDGEMDEAATIGWQLRNYAFGSNATGIDFTSGLPQTGNVTFAAGETFKNVIIGTVNDTVVEGTEFVEFVLTGGTSPSTVPVEVTPGPSYGTIYDNDFNIELRAYGSAAQENSGQLAFTIYRTGETNASVTVNYSFESAAFAPATSDDVSGGLPQTGSVTFAANETSKVIVLGIVPDSNVENDEYVALRLTGATTPSVFGLDVQTTPAYGLIYNDDFNINLGVQGYSANEGDDLTFTLTRTGDTSAAVTANYAIAAAGAASDDVTNGLPQAGSVTFAVGETSKTVTVGTVEDAVVEPNEHITLTINSATTLSSRTITGIGSAASAYILNDDFPVQFSASYAFGDEDDGPLVFTVLRSGNTTVAATVNYSFALYPYAGGATSDDIVGGLPQAGVLSFAANETQRTISITPNPDATVEGTEYVQFNLSDATAPAGVNATILSSTSYGYIYNDDFAPRITVSGGGSFIEGRTGLTPVTFTFARQGNPSDTTTVTYDLLPVGSTPADSQDIDSVLPANGRMVTFNPGETTKTVVVNIVGDGFIEPHQDFELRVTGTSSSLSLTYDLVGGVQGVRILNDDGVPPVLPPGIGIRGFTFGDPHIVTLDGLTYSFMAVGEFVMLETISGARDPFQLQARFEPAPGSSLVSLTTGVAIEVAGRTVEFAAIGDHLLIDGGVTEIDPDLGAMDIDGDAAPDVFLSIVDGRPVFTVLLNDSGEQLRVEVMDGYLNTTLSLADDREGAVRGLMGNGDGQTGNDLALRDGTELDQPVAFDQLYGDFASDWRIGGTEAPSLFTYAEGENTDTFTDLSFPVGVIDLSTVPDSIREAAEDAANDAGILDPILREAAILDYIFTGNPSFLTGASTVDPESTSGLEIENAPELPVSVGIAGVEASVVEGDSGTQQVAFTIYRTGPTTEAITVNYAISGVNAADLQAGTALTGTVLLAAGVSETTLNVAVTGDLTTESDETLIVTLTGTTLGVIGAATGQTIIVTDDSPPIAEDDSFTAGADGTVTDNLFAPNAADLADRDPDSDPISVVAVNGAPLVEGTLDVLLSYGTATVSATGSLNYATDERAGTLAAAAIGIETFTYQISDGQGGFATATVNIAVQAPAAAVNTAPIASNGLIYSTEDTAGVLFELGPLSFDADGDTTTWEIDGVTGGEVIGFNAATGTGTFVPDPEFVGEAFINWTVTDLGGLSDVGILTVDLEPVNDAPVADDLTFNEDEDFPGALFSLAGLTQDVDGVDLSWTITNVVGGTMTGFDPLSGLGTFAPTANFNGEARIDWSVTDAGGLSDTGSITIDISAVKDAPVDPEGDDAALGLSTGEDTALVISVAALLADEVNPADEVQSAALAGLSGAVGGTVQNNGDGTLTFTPEADFSGAGGFFYTAEDEQGAVGASVWVPVAVVPDENAAPEASNGDASTDEDMSLSFDLALLTFDADGNVTSWTIDNVIGGSVTGFDAATGTGTFVPDADYNGPARIDWTVTDAGGLSDAGVLAIDVTPVGDPPIDPQGDDAALTLTTPEDTALVIAVAALLADDVVPLDEIYEPALHDLSGAVGGSVQDSGDGTITFTPDADFNGEGGFFYRAQGEPGAVGSKVWVPVTVTPVNDAPVATDLALTAQEDSPPVLFSLADLSGDAEGDALAWAVTAVVGGTITGFDPLSGLGTFAPTGDFNGEARIEWTVTDAGGLSDDGAIVIDIAAVNDAPVAGNDVFAVAAGSAPFTANLLANDSDIDGDPLAVTGYTSAANGTVSVLANGSLTYTPNPGFSGTDSFGYTIGDGQGGTSSATVTLDVEADEFEFNVVAGSPNQAFLRGTAAADALIFDTSRSTQAFGGDGADVFVFDRAGDGTRDVAFVRDFQQGLDHIDVGDTPYTLRIVGANSVITLAGADRDTLTVSNAVLTAADFTTDWTAHNGGVLT